MTSSSAPRLRRWPAVLATLLLLPGVLTPAFAASADRDGSWQWPLQPSHTVLRGYEPPTDPWGPGHRGVDLGGHVGQAVLSVDTGQVTFAGYVAGRGVVSVRHGALRATYQPVVPLVHAGDPVVAGDELGQLTLVGSHCLPDPCLHLGARQGDRYVDPLSLLGAVEIRLKPLLSPPAAPGRSTRRPPSPPQLPRRVSGIARSGAWVGLTVGGAQPLRGDVGVDLRRRQ